MALFLASPLTLAATQKTMSKKMKPTPEHTAAVKKCNEDYTAAVKEAKTKKGKDRSAALTAAKKEHSECLKNAPK